MSAQEPKQQQLPPAPPLPQPPKLEPWFEKADKDIKARREDLNNKFLILRQSSRGSEEVKASLKTIIQELKDLTADFPKHSRAIKEHLLKGLTALYKPSDGRPCEYFSSSDRMMEMSKKRFVASDKKGGEAYRALSRIERHRQKEETHLERMREAFEEAEYEMVQNSNRGSRRLTFGGAHPGEMGERERMFREEMGIDEEDRQSLESMESRSRLSGRHRPPPGLERLVFGGAQPDEMNERERMLREEEMEIDEDREFLESMESRSRLSERHRPLPDFDSLGMGQMLRDEMRMVLDMEMMMDRRRG